MPEIRFLYGNLPEDDSNLHSFLSGTIFSSNYGGIVKGSSRSHTHKADCFYTAVNFLCPAQLGGRLARAGDVTRGNWYSRKEWAGRTGTGSSFIEERKLDSNRFVSKQSKFLRLEDSENRFSAGE